jgi:hypothetical protein
MELTIQEIEKRLKEPFPLSEIKWKPQAISRDKTKAMAVPFIDARAVMERLDAVVGAFNWQIRHVESESAIGIRHPDTGEWIWKGDVGYVAGEESDNEDTQAMGVKGSASDGLKRAGVVWGIFRYSYDVPKQWVKWDADGRKFLESPTLPNWALPEKKNVAPVASNSNTQRATANNTQPTQTNRQGEVNKPNVDKTVEEEKKQKENYSRQHPPLSPVQRNKLTELWKLLNGGAEVKDELAFQGLDKLFTESFKHGLADATYEEAARLTGELLSQLRARTNSTGTTTTNSAAPTLSPIKAPTIKNVADWTRVVNWAVESKFIPNAKAQMELFRITDKAGIAVIDETNIKQVTQLINDAFKQKA